MIDTDDFYRAIRANIDKHGRHLIMVMPTADEPIAPFCYTIGNAERGLPELLIVGIGPSTASFVLNALSDKMVERGRAFDDLDVVSLGGPAPVCVVDADERVKDDYTLQVGRALNIAEHAYRVQQVVVTDPEGRLPWHRDCAEPYKSLPVYRKGGVQ